MLGSEKLQTIVMILKIWEKVAWRFWVMGPRAATVPIDSSWKAWGPATEARLC